MDTTLAINPGSSSKKYALYRDGREVLSVVFERIGEGFGKCVEINKTRQHCEDISATVYGDALPEVLTILTQAGMIVGPHDIASVSVRIVAPGTFFQKHRLIDEGYSARLERVADAAPLHIPAVLDELRHVRRILPHARIVGASDSAYHATIPSYARTYSIPEADTHEFDMYRFGYHGLSVGSVVRAVTKEQSTVPSRMIVCHIGSGVSVTALHDGVSIDTTMGFAPGSGLMMGTRAGDIDPSALLYILRKKGLQGIDAERYINEVCGIKGVLGTSDLRIALDRMARGEGKAIDAVRMYMYRIQKAIGAYVMALDGLDTLVLTATAAERNPAVRTLVCERLVAFGVSLDTHANDVLHDRMGVISTPESDVQVLVVPTDEMGEMARIAGEI
jgi:acetate kinase